MFTPSEELAENQANERSKLKRKYQECANEVAEKSSVEQEFITIDELLPEEDTVLPSTSDETSPVSATDLNLAYQSASGTEPSEENISSTIYSDLDKPVKLEEIDLSPSKDQVTEPQSSKQIEVSPAKEGSEVSEKTSNPKDFTKVKVKTERFEQELEYSSERNYSQNKISVSQSNFKAHKKYPERDSVVKCRETESPVKSGNLRPQRTSSNDVVRDQLRIGTLRENRDMRETYHRENLGKSTLKYRDERRRPKSPLDSRPEKNDRLHTRNIYERGSESKSTGGSFKGNNNKARSRSISRSRSPKRQSRFEVQREQSKKYTGRSRRSKSPEDIKKTFMDIMYGDKDRVIKKETASSSLMDFVFDKGNKAHVLEFVNASSSSLPPSHFAPGPYPEPVYGYQFCVEAEKQDKYAQETLQSDFYRQPQFQERQPFVVSYRTDPPPFPLVNIKTEPQVQGNVGYMSNFPTSQAYGPQYNIEYEEILPYNYNIS